MRLDKAAALSGLTRTEARRAILAGRVKVKGESVRDAAAQVNPEDVTVDGQPVSLALDPTEVKMIENSKKDK